MARRSRKRPPGKTIGSHELSARQSRFLKHKTLSVAVTTAAVLIALAAYYVIRGRMRERIATSSSATSLSAASANGPQRFIGGANFGYVDAGSCAACHQEIARTYSQTGMGRAFYRARPENMAEAFAKPNTYRHAPSGDHYTMLQRGEQFYQRRHQLDDAGREINVFERQIHYVMGSGKHARTYLHLDPAGKLTQLPLGWYAERGGFWAMNPNYDQPRHMGFQREIGFGCMFCHNGYPEVAPGDDAQGREPRFRGRLPEGIDCQRCHGPGRDHIKALKAGAGQEKIRAAILNPARLNPERQLEICMQCHLETTTRSLPHAVVRFDRNVFSFRPGEPLADYVLNFDYAPGHGRDDRFEIAHMAYRLRKSACFLATAGTRQAITCTTCHNPHKTSPGVPYIEVCRQCHAAAFNARVALGRHTASHDCLGCHMPKRRADDVIHAVMTDHYIQRHKPDRDLLAALAELPETEATRYRGEVVLYYPPRLPQTAETELYLAAAQVIDAANLAAGIPRLRHAVEMSRPKQAGFYFHLAEAYWRSGNAEEAFRMYEAALARAPKHRDAWLNYSVALSKAGRTEQAARVLEQAIEHLPSDPLLLSNLGEVYLGDGFTKPGIQSKSLEVLRRAVDIDPNLPAAQNNLGLAYSRIGNNESAVRAWKEAIRLQPDYPLAHNNLANSLADQEQFGEAETHYRLAIRFNPRYDDAHFNYAALLVRLDRFAQAESELREVIRLNPNSALAYNNLANLLRQQGNTPGAIAQYRLALEKDPALDKPHLGLGMALGSQGDFPAARKHFELASRSTDPTLRREAQEALKKIQMLHRP